MRYTVLKLSIISAALLVACGQTEPHSKQSHIPQTSSQLPPAKHMVKSTLQTQQNWKGMTWRVLKQKGNVVQVGADQGTNPKQGDTSAQAELPILCLNTTQKNIKPASLKKTTNWTQGELRLTPAVDGTTIDSLETANQICISEFGTGWRMAQFQEGKNQGQYHAQGKLNNQTRFWVNIPGQKANLWNSDGEKPQIKMTSQTRVLGLIDRNNLVSFKPSLIVIKKNTPLVGRLMTGDVVISQPSRVAPDGFLKKVVSIQTKGNKVFIKTKNAQLTEALEKGKLSKTKALNMADIDYGRSGQAIQALRSTIEAKKAKMGAQRDIRLFDIHLTPFCLYSHNGGNSFLCDDGNPNGLKSKIPAGNYIALTSDLRATADAFVNLDINGARVQHFDIGTKLSEKAYLQILGDGRYSWNVNKEIKQWKIAFPPIVFKAGPVPIVIRSSLTPTMGTNGEIVAQVQYEVNQSFDARYGAQFQKGSGWSKIAEQDNVLNSKKPVFTGRVSTQAYLGTKSRMGLYSEKLSNIYVHSKATIEGNTTIDAKNKNGAGSGLCTFGGLGGDIGVEMPIISRKGWGTPIGKYNKRIECWEEEKSFLD